MEGKAAPCCMGRVYADLHGSDGTVLGPWSQVVLPTKAVGAFHCAMGLRRPGIRYDGVAQVLCCDDVLAVR